MGALKNITGQKFGRLTIVEDSKKRDKHGGVIWKCQCTCGEVVFIRSRSLIKGHTRSCGCFSRQRASEVTTERMTSHGKSYDPIHYIWDTMKSRCYNSKNLSYPRYGGRGIKVCDRWLNSFENFYEDMGDPPKGMSIERIDNSGDYSPENCRWATAAEQARNRRSNRLVTLGKKTMLLIEWQEQLGVSRSTYYSRLKRGLSIEEALLTPINLSCSRSKAAA